MEKYDFSGWATRNDLKCSDGRIIRRDAFKHCDGLTVPLVWNHDHEDPYRIVGHALLENRKDGVYTYGTFNDTELGKTAKIYVEHGDITQLSIYANQLTQQGPNVMHGSIREVSLVMAGANPGARIESVMAHSDALSEEGIILSLGEDITLFHSDDHTEETAESKDEELKTEVSDDEGETVQHAEKEETSVAENKETKEVKETKETKEAKEKTVKEVFDEMSEEQKNVVYALVGMAYEQVDEDEKDDEDDDSKGGNESMKHNLFDQEETTQGGVLTHSDQEAIIKLARTSGVGTLQAAISKYTEENASLQHGIDQIETLFPEYKDVRPGAPELIERDQTWVGEVMKKTHKSPISRIRTRQADARGNDLRAKGYQKKGDEKKVSGNIKLMGRTTDPQTVYRKDSLHRDDIIDITDFDVVEYQYGVMKHNLYEDIALATMVGDLREDGDPDKIQEEHIRPIWKDDELYTIHYDVDIEAARTELQGSNTGANFGENYIYAEAVVTASLYSREQYKGSGNLEFYCTPHLLNVMLLARDLNGRRIYDSKADLAKALNVSAIHTAEQFEGLTRTTKEGKEKELLGLFVNLNDYQHGSTKGGEITRFDQFDIDFNLNKYLIETRLSGALTRIKSAIALEMPVVGAAG
jgi:hypothetical protein